MAASRLSRLGLSLVLGGALGNLYDRLARGAVTDFLDFYIGSYHWPAFNVADSALSVGAAWSCWIFGDPGGRRRRAECCPNSSRSATSSFPPTGCWSRRASCLACGWPRGWRAERPGHGGGPQPGDLLRAGRHPGRQAADAHLSTSTTTAKIPREIFSLATLQAGGVFQGGLILALATAFFYMRRSKLPGLATADVLRAGRCAGARHRPAGLLRGGLLLGPGVPPALGRDVHQSGREPAVRHAAQRSAASDAALRGRRRSADLRRPVPPVPACPPGRDDHRAVPRAVLFGAVS